MQKIVILMYGALMMSTAANACGGFVIKGDSGASYCLSKHTMNWYSAYAWCNDQKLRLIDVGAVCKSGTSCSELKLSDDEKKHITDNGGTVGWVWTNTSSGSDSAFGVNLSSGNVNGNYRHGRDYYHYGTYALCF